MLGYVTLGTNDLTKAATFYDELLATIGGKRFMEEDGFIAWIRKDEETSIAITQPFNKEPASIGNGTMIAFYVESPEQVKAFYEKALALGASCEGKPGFRPAGATQGFYAGYFRDLDGNKLNAFCMVGDTHLPAE